ncbi:MAG TPA: hypothetical protein GXX19_01205 [Syntrophomonadaceae bacterium]|nr:hypothetical protein [Syntrophomonadaceae bacterium]
MPPKQHHQKDESSGLSLQAQRPYGGCYLALSEEQLTAAEAKQEFDRRLFAMDGVIGAGRLPSATSLRAS